MLDAQDPERVDRLADTQSRSRCVQSDRQIRVPERLGQPKRAITACSVTPHLRCDKRLNGTRRDKVAAGFTNSGAKAGDKMHTLSSLAVFAAQHHMHWVNLGLGAGWNSASGSEDDLNRLGFWLGAAASTDVDADADAVHPSDLHTAHHLGRRVALVTRQLSLGRAASTPEASSATAH